MVPSGSFSAYNPGALALSQARYMIDPGDNVISVLLSAIAFALSLSRGWKSERIAASIFSRNEQEQRQKAK
jgi:predicted ribosome quality control (RQC) complex YloA/Tae2 family protein